MSKTKSEEYRRYDFSVLDVAKALNSECAGTLHEEGVDRFAERLEWLRWRCGPDQWHPTPPGRGILIECAEDAIWSLCWAVIAACDEVLEQRRKVS